jgi:hypothetical protein
VAAGGSPGTSDSVALAPAGADLAAYAFGDFPSEWSWNQGTPTIRQRRQPGSDAVTVGMEFSSDLRLWTPTGAVETAGTIGEDGRVFLERQLPTGAQGFIRWRITRREP